MLWFVVAVLVGCSRDDAVVTTDAGGDAVDATPPPRTVTFGDSAYEKAGPAPVGHAIFTASDAARSRTLTIQLWYPAAEGARAAAAAGTPIEDLVVDPTDHATFGKLLADAPPCTRRRVSSARDAEPASGSFPLVAFSHCHGCLRFSEAEVAERLASHGFAVIAPDHAGNTLFDAQRGMNAPLSGTYLATRAADVSFALDVALDSANTNVPASLRGRFDASRVGMFGHSYGGATTGLVLVRDARVKAGLAMAAPMENDLLPPAKMADIHVPVMFFVAREDNSISEIGNNLMRSNFQHASPPSWIAEVDDAGHWSFSDVCGLVPAFAAGCGEGVRQTDPGTTFSYLDNEGARRLAAAYVTSFFAATLNGDAAARAFLSAPHPSGLVTAQAR